jgi:hypothetical protein
MLAKISGIVYLAAAGMLYGLCRLWQGKEPIGTTKSGEHQLFVILPIISYFGSQSRRLAQNRLLPCDSLQLPSLSLYYSLPVQQRHNYKTKGHARKCAVNIEPASLSLVR